MQSPRAHGKMMPHADHLVTDRHMMRALACFEQLVRKLQAAIARSKLTTAEQAAAVPLMRRQKGAAGEALRLGFT